MATPGALQAQLAQARSPEEYVDMLQHGVTHFPRTALFWRLYAEHERSLSGPASGLAVLEGGGSSALPWCRCDPELWRVACELRRDCGRREDELGPESKALGSVGRPSPSRRGADAAPLWRCYVDWCANAAPVSLRKKLRRSALERACLVPGAAPARAELDRKRGNLGPRAQGSGEMPRAPPRRRAQGRRRAVPALARRAPRRRRRARQVAHRRAAKRPRKKSTATDLLPAETKAAALHYACGRRRVAAAYRAACDANAGDAPELFLEFASVGLRASKKLSAKIYEAHAALELSMNGDVDAARRTFELGLSQRPELLLANDATYVLAYAAFLESAAGDAEAAAAVVERAVAAKGERDAPPALWDALASLAHRNATARNGARARRRREAPPASTRSAALWRRSGATSRRRARRRSTPSTRRGACARPCRRRCPGISRRAATRPRSSRPRADGLLADEYDNGGLDADDLADDGGEGDGLFAALARGKLPEAFRRLADLAHRKAAGPRRRRRKSTPAWTAPMVATSSATTSAPALSAADAE
ncbi:hypothetical protein JL722_1103 [Aureococcus anophagefferens]|nr:hypothetical protein JL722_1103 [Aureococcus anophagefferens]